jgi:hypothetical protein
VVFDMEKWKNGNLNEYNDLVLVVCEDIWDGFIVYYFLISNALGLMIFVVRLMENGKPKC